MNIEVYYLPSRWPWARLFTCVILYIYIYVYIYSRFEILLVFLAAFLNAALMHKEQYYNLNNHKTNNTCKQTHKSDDKHSTKINKHRGTKEQQKNCSLLCNFALVLLNHFSWYRPCRWHFKSRFASFSISSSAPLAKTLSMVGTI